MESPVKLYDYQLKAAARWVRDKRSYIAFPMGFGKTHTACSGLSLIMGQNVGNQLQVLTICPAKVISSWEKHLDQWGLSATIVSYNKLKSLPYQEFDVVIVDEAHHIKNRKSNTTQNVQVLTKSAKYVLMLSGTPSPNRPADVWKPMNMLWGYKTSQSWTDFCTKWCECTFWGDIPTPGKLKREMRAEFQQFLGKHLIFPSERNQINIPPVRFSLTESAPTPDSDTMYFTWLRDSADKYANQHNITSIHGETPIKRRLQKIDNCRAQSESLVATVDSVGEGINNLIGYKRGVFLELAWTPAKILQAIGRLARIGSPHAEIEIIFVVPRGSIQERMAYLLKQKLVDYSVMMGDNEDANKIANDILGGEMTEDQFAKMALSASTDALDIPDWGL